MTIRAQYHFRSSPQGLLAWDVRRLIDLSSTLPTVDVALSKISELDENHWFQYSSPTCRQVLEHAALIAAADLAFPIILDQNGRVMDGMHQVCKALQTSATTIRCVQFNPDPAPDYVNVNPDELPYDS